MLSFSINVLLMGIPKHERVGKVTISIGVTALKGKERAVTFQKCPDKVLYKAKREGRNRFGSHLKKEAFTLF